jgi:hypothetical protein
MTSSGGKGSDKPMLINWVLKGTSQLCDCCVNSGEVKEEKLASDELLIA